MSDSDDPLIDAASRAADNAYAPYSRFSVGAALRTRAGGVFIGCNVENAAYPVGTCAERGAIAAAIAIEGAGMEIAAIAIVARNDGRDAPCAPCGACRQAIAEFGGTADVAYRGPDMQYRSRKVAALLPDGFTFAPADED